MSRAAPDYGVRRVTLSLVLAVTVLLIGGLAVQSYRTMVMFDREITPDLGHKAAAVARIIATQTQRLAVAGNPLDRLNGFAAFARQVAGQHPEIAHVRLLGGGGETLDGVELRAAGETIELRQPVVVDNRAVGHVAVGYDALVVRDALAEIIYDILTTLLVAALLAFELILVVVTINIGEPIRQLARVLVAGRFHHLPGRMGIGDVRRICLSVNATVMDLHHRYLAIAARARALGERLPDEAAHLLEGVRDRLEVRGNRPRRLLLLAASDVRLPLFVFFLSTELSRSFMPLFADALYQPILGLSREIAITLPLSGYMAVSALAMPFAGTLVERFGVRRVFLGGLLPSIVAYVMVALSTSLSEMILWRCVGAAGAAGVTIAALGHIALYSSAAQRAAGMAIYSGTFVAAGVCGSSIGGILADRMGFAPTFLFSAGLTLLSALLVLTMLGRGVDGQASRAEPTRVKDVLRVVTQPDFAALVVGVAIPAGVITMGQLFYTTPLLLDALGESQSAIGRYIMLYFLVMIVLNHTAARLGDRWGSHHLFLAVGILSHATAPLLVSLSETTWAVAVGVMLIGVGNALCGPAQGAVLLHISQHQGRAGQHTVAIAVFRVLERVGLVIGPLLAAALAGSFTRSGSARILGFYALLSALVFILHAAINRRFSWQVTGRSG